MSLQQPLCCRQCASVWKRKKAAVYGLAEVVTPWQDEKLAKKKREGVLEDKEIRKWGGGGSDAVE